MLRRAASRIFACTTLLLMVACGSTRIGAPVVERAEAPAEASKQAQAAPTPAPVAPAAIEATPGATALQYHTVKSGDTLYSIALDRGVDYRELASLNGITDPSRIQLGQQLRLPEPAKGAVTAPLSMPGGVTGTPIAKPIGNTAVLKTAPKGTKLPYTDEAWSKLSGTQVAKADPVPPTTGFPPPNTDVPPSSSASPTQAAVESGVDWGWPTRGRMIAGFSDVTKGLEIGGNSGQPVVASAAGKVVYAGSGLPRYGKLVIIKHNDVYLSVYAHNRAILVKEGQSVAKGQKIAEMGDTDADQVKLHFEIRRYGKPVDPAQYLSGDLPS